MSKYFFNHVCVETLTAEQTMHSCNNSPPAVHVDYLNLKFTKAIFIEAS